MNHMINSLDKDWNEPVICPECGHVMEEDLTDDYYYCQNCKLYYDIDNTDPDPDNAKGGADDY